MTGSGLTTWRYDSLQVTCKRFKFESSITWQEKTYKVFRTSRYLTEGPRCGSIPVLTIQKVSIKHSKKGFTFMMTMNSPSTPSIEVNLGFFLSFSYLLDHSLLFRVSDTFDKDVHITPVYVSPCFSSYLLLDA